jgi:DNA-binding CsgD family transcriptional regulator
MTVTTRLFWFVTAAVIAVALGSFSLSFMALYALATGNGIPPLLGWIWPLIVDVSMVIYTAAILVSQLQNRGAKLPIALTVFYAIVTITGNILHAPPTWLGWFVAMLPPLSLIFGTEMLRAMAHHNILQRGVVATLEQLQAQATESRMALQNLDAQIASKTEHLARLNADIQQAKSSKTVDFAESMRDSKQQKIDERRDAVLQLLQAGNNERAIAEQLGRDIRTIKADIVALNGKAQAVSQ